MKTKLHFIFAILGLFLSSSLYSQSNYSVQLAAGQRTQNMWGLTCCNMKVNVATDDAGSAYVLSEIAADSSIWVTKYDNTGAMIYNVRVGRVGFETDFHYAAKKIRVYDRVYVLSTTRSLYGTDQNTYQTVYVMDKFSGAVNVTYQTFIPYPGDTKSEMVDLAVTDNTIYLVGQSINGPGAGGNKIHVMKSDLTWTGNLYLLGNDGGTDYLLNTESNCLTTYQGGLYVTGQTSGALGNRIFIEKLDVLGFKSEYVYQNALYTGGKGLGIAAEGNSIYVAGSLTDGIKGFKTTVLKIDSNLSTLAWININKNSVWPLGFQLSSTNVIYTVDFTLKVVGFSKTNGNQLFAKDDFKSFAQVYNQPISTCLISGDQLLIQASVGTKVGRLATQTKVLAKYNTLGKKIFQETVPVALISPGNPGSSEAQGLAYSSATNMSIEVFRQISQSGDVTIVQGRYQPNSLRIANEPEKVFSELTVYPNPAHGAFTITSEKKIVHWFMFDSLLRQLEETNADANEINANCSKYPPGIYVIRIVTEDGNTETKKIILN
jgi:hypothetical protein